LPWTSRPRGGGTPSSASVATVSSRHGVRRLTASPTSSPCAPARFSAPLRSFHLKARRRPTQAPWKQTLPTTWVAAAPPDLETWGICRVLPARHSRIQRTPLFGGSTLADYDIYAHRGFQERPERRTPSDIDLKQSRKCPTTSTTSSRTCVRSATGPHREARHQSHYHGWQRHVRHLRPVHNESRYAIVGGDLSIDPAYNIRFESLAAARSWTRRPRAARTQCPSTSKPSEARCLRGDRTSLSESGDLIGRVAASYPHRHFAVGAEDDDGPGPARFRELHPALHARGLNSFDFARSDSRFHRVYGPILPTMTGPRTGHRQTSPRLRAHLLTPGGARSRRLAALETRIQLPASPLLVVPGMSADIMPSHQSDYAGENDPSTAWQEMPAGQAAFRQCRRA